MKNKDKKEYIKSPNHCPFCKGEDINEGDYDFKGNIVWSNVYCSACKKEWEDIFTLTNVKERV